MKHGFIKVAAAAPEIRVADPAYNGQSVIACARRAGDKGVRLLVLPELCLTGSTCGHLFYQRTLLDGAMDALRAVADATRGLDMLILAGMPVEAGGQIFSAAAALYGGTVLALVPRTAVDGTVFSRPGAAAGSVDIPGLGRAPLSSGLCFEHSFMPGLTVAVQVGADRSMPLSPAAALAASGATVIAELGGAPMSVFSAKRRLEEMSTDSRRLCCGYISADPGKGESTTDRAYSGLCAVAENGVILASVETGVSMAVSELDCEYLLDARRRSAAFRGPLEPAETLGWGAAPQDAVLTRRYSPTPFLPDAELDEFCRRALEIQVIGVTRRMEYTGLFKPVVGVSGGVDSTLVMLACAKALKDLGLPSENLIAVTMPCFGTTDRTKSNAITIAERLGATLKVINIKDSVLQQFKDIGHDPEDTALVFENAQARVRTMCLLDIANMVGGLDIGTKDLSEQADGWCTFNGDQISNYDINAGLTKTMVRAVVRYIADRTEDGELRGALNDIQDTPVTPELLPPSRNGELLQKSEDSVGPYILQDFFLYHMVMRGGSPEKVLRLAEYAFAGEFDRETIVRWLKSYCRRFFSQQFKRSCSADGPDAVGFTLSPRDGHKMPSDASGDLWRGLAESL